MSLLLIYIAFHVPYRVCLYWDDDSVTSSMEIVENISDCFFWFDIFLNFNTAVIDGETGKLTTSRRGIALRYAKGFLIIDVLASFPFAAVGGSSAKTLNKTGRLMRLSKGVRLLRLLKLMRVVKLQQMLHMLESEFSIHHGLSRMAKIIFMVMLVTHVVGCMWYLVGKTGGSDTVNGGWQWRENYSNHTRSEQYVTSLYWAFSTLTTVGYGDISARTMQVRHERTEH